VWQIRAVLVALATFAAASALLIVVPGPDNVLIVRDALRYGRFVALRTAAGTLTGVVIWVLAAAFGLSALLAASRVGYDSLRLLGAAYLVWLGVGSLRARGRVALDVRSTPDLSFATGRTGYLMGIVSNLVNPKTGVFFIAFFPAFIPRGSSIEATSLLFGALFFLEAAAWFGVVIWLVSRLAAWLSQRRVQRRLDQDQRAALDRLRRPRDHRAALIVNAGGDLLGVATLRRPAGGAPITRAQPPAPACRRAARGTAGGAAVPVGSTRRSPPARRALA
jgi:threonine/homoserine/homoserine lactone efflux protein